ncbi:hypothetical protein [Streptomyces minutiscleroticus]|uniref:Uncharacterized protein n=1 Tax=Streptomyces minutiscleroticus TaxID=68238 RepID=A0A918KVW3_9ACTN|nr:hypothetical protein [Streptomyces minutiscleroticus]GGX75976.1 hypothetical protein GCM10010358_32940 [Streptomyces minutiscleroticus]
MSENAERAEGRKKPAGTATDEVLEELKDLGRQEDTDTRRAEGGEGDPISPSVPANEEAAEEEDRTPHRH